MKRLPPEPEVDERALRKLQQAEAQHLAWLKRVHMALFFGGSDAGRPSELPQEIVRWAEREGDGGGNRDGRLRALERLGEADTRMGEQAAVLMAKAATPPGIAAFEYGAFMAMVEAYYRELRRLEYLLWASLAETDPLTGIRNRRHVMQDLKREWGRAMRHAQSCSIALVDLDRFKEINDRFGHQVGDRVLLAAVRFFRRRLRPYDLIYRHNGDEFLFCLPNTDRAAAQKILNRLRGVMERLPVALADGRKVRVTASVGIAEMDSPDSPPQTAVARADAACFEAKRAGRNRVCVWPAAGAEACGPGDPSQIRADPTGGFR